MVNSKSIEKISFEEAYYAFCKIIGISSDLDPSLSFKSRYPGVLESSVVQPFQQIGGKDLYPELLDKAAAIFYFCIKNHPLEDGNKRLALLLLFILLYKNGYWIKSNNDKLYNFTIEVASSKTEDIQDTFSYIKSFLEEHIYEN